MPVLDASSFAIGFDPRDREALHRLWDEVIDSQQWTEGRLTERFEEAWERWNGIGAVATAGWSGAALAALDYAGVRGQTVLCPSNTFPATPLAAMAAGAQVEFVDCNRHDLCASFESFEQQALRHKPRAAFVVHIGGHIAFDIERIADFCRDQGIFLIEDCAHAHGAEWNGRRPGSFGDAGLYSLYATKTMSTGEGGIIVSHDADLLEHARAYRNYGKPDYRINGLNQRMSEFTAALGLVEVERLPEIVRWKNEAARELDESHPSRLELPDGMTSGLYKYIVFDPIERSTGKVYDQPCHRLFGHHGDELPNSDWVAKNHWCVPLYYRPGS